MSFKPKFSELSLKDLNKLDGSQKKQIAKSIEKIEQYGMAVGEQLHGELFDCRKLKHKKLGLRVIFRQSDIGIEIIEIVVIGKRADSEVYDIARKRLGR